MKRIAVLGAGISGLSLGWYLKRRFGESLSLHVIEKNSRPGGWCQTVREKGFLFECGPRSFRTRGNGVHTLKLIEQLGLQEEVIAANPSAASRFVLINGSLKPLPKGLFSLAVNPWLWGIFPALLQDLMARKEEGEDESVFSFFERRLGAKLTERLVDPLVLGIYAGDMRKLSVRSCFSDLHTMVSEQGSLIRGWLKSVKAPSHSNSPFVQKMLKAPLFSLRGGVEDLCVELSQRLEDTIVYNQEVKALHCLPQEAVVEFADGSELSADHLFSTLPANQLAKLFSPMHQEATSMLEAIPFASVAVVGLGYHRKVMRKKGFGYLIPSSEQERILGVVFDSCVFPQQNQIPEETRLTIMMRENEGLSQDKLELYAKEAASRHLGIDSEPDACVVHRAAAAIPQYVVGHAKKIAALEQIINRFVPRLTLHGSSFQGVSVNDCIAASKAMEESLL